LAIAFSSAVVVTKPGRDRLADFREHLLERLTVLGLPDGVDVRAEKADLVTLQDACLGQVGGEIQAGLAAQRGEQGVGPLTRDDPLDRFDGERFEIDAIRDLLVGHDRGRVGVDEDRDDALLAERLARLGARVVELGCLADDDGPGAENQDLLGL